MKWYNVSIENRRSYMSQKKLSIWLKAIIICTGLIGVFACAVIIPNIGKAIIASYPDRPEMQNWFVPWLIFALISAVPCYLALISAWKIACEISRDNSFSHKNARSMKNISIFALIDSVYVFAGNIVMMFLKMTHGSVFISLMLVTAVGMIITVAAACLSHLIEKAAVLKDENDEII